MKTLKTLILTLAFISSVNANTGFEQLFHLHPEQASSTADRVTNFHADNMDLSTTDKINELNALSNNIDAYIKASPDNPVLWFIKGLNYSNLASVYNAQGSTPQVESSIVNKNIAYEKAMQLDKTVATLTAAIYATMKHGLPEDLKINAIQKELALGGNGETESSYWYLHWSNINALQNAGRAEEAKLALQKMKSEMFSQGISNPDYDELTKQVEQNLNQPSQNITEQQKPATSRHKKTAKKERDNIFRVENLTWLLITIIIIALILAWKYEMLIFKKKR